MSTNNVPIPEERAGSMEKGTNARCANPICEHYEDEHADGFSGCNVVFDDPHGPTHCLCSEFIDPRNPSERAGREATESSEWESPTKGEFEVIHNGLRESVVLLSTHRSALAELEAQLAAQPSVQRDEVALRKLLESIRDDDSGRDHFRYCRTNVYYPGLKALQDDRCSICEAIDVWIEKLRITAERGSK